MRTQVAIIGAGPAGLLLAHLLHLRGIDSVVLERHDRAHIEARIRAGVLEQGSVDLLTKAGLADRLHAERLVHHGLELLFDGVGHHVPLTELAGRELTIYGQHELVKDLVAARLDTGRPLLFEAPAVAVEDLDTRLARGPLRPQRTDRGAALRRGGRLRRFPRREPAGGAGGRADRVRARVPVRVAGRAGPGGPVVRGADLRRARPRVRAAQHALAERDPAVPAGGAGRAGRRTGRTSGSGRSCAPGSAAPTGFDLHDGPIVDKAVTALRSFVVEPMRHGRLFLAGDAAHIVPATGAKGLNLAVVDVAVLAARRSAASSPTATRRAWSPIRTRVCPGSGGYSTSRGG